MTLSGFAPLTAKDQVCHITGCEQPIAYTKSWRNGPTIHACHAHHFSLPSKKPVAGEPVQGALL